MTAAQARLAETIDSFYADNSDAAMSAHSYRRAVGDLEAKTSRELDAPFRATVLEPIGKMCSYWPEINNAISKRNKKVRSRSICLRDQGMQATRRGRGTGSAVPSGGEGGRSAFLAYLPWRTPLSPNYPLLRFLDILNPDIDSSPPFSLSLKSCDLCSPPFPVPSIFSDNRLRQLLDYDAARTKARKLTEKPSDDSSKLPLAEKASEDAREGECAGWTFGALEKTVTAPRAQYALRVNPEMAGREEHRLRPIGCSPHNSLSLSVPLLSSHLCPLCFVLSPTTILQTHTPRPLPPLTRTHSL